jgi:Rrf2 family protein
MILDIARHGGEGRPVPLAAVALRTDLSHGYLEQMASSLRRARLLRGVSGRNGGYRLAKPSSEIGIGDVVEASIGPICIVDCVADPSICARAVRCETRALYCLLNRRIIQELEALTLADLLDPSWVSEHGGFALEDVTPRPEGADPCTAPHGPRRGRPRVRREKVTATRQR